MANPIVIDENRAKELDVVVRAKAALDAVAAIVQEAKEMGVLISWAGVGPGKRGKFEVLGFAATKDLTADLT